MLLSITSLTYSLSIHSTILYLIVTIYCSFLNVKMQLYYFMFPHSFMPIILAICLIMIHSHDSLYITSMLILQSAIISKPASLTNKNSKL